MQSDDLYVTKRTKFHWKDLKHVINFVDNLTEIAHRMKTLDFGWD